MENTHSAPPNRRPYAAFALTFLLGAGLAFAGFALSSATGNGDAVVTVNGEPISREAFYQRLELEAGEAVLDQLITELLVVQSAKRYPDVAVTDEEVASEIDEIKSSYGSEEAFNEALRRYNVTMEQLEYDIRLNLIVSKLTRRGIDVTEDEIKAYFDANKAILDQPERVLVRHILVATREEADALAAQLKEGADFARLAAEHSTDPGTAANGGVVGYIHAGSPIVPAFKAAALKLEAGAVSEPVQTEFGWHLIRVDERVPAEEATLESSRETIREILLGEKARPVNEIIAELRAGAVVEVHWPRYDVFANDPSSGE